MPTEDLLLQLLLCLLGALLGGWAMDRMRQPPVMGYILAGVVLAAAFGDHLPPRGFFEAAGELGLMLMLFFVGTEVDVRRLREGWKVSILGALLVALVSTLLCLGVGRFVGWDVPRSLFFGFVLSLSSTAVVLRILEEFGGTSSYIGRNALGILLVQDLLVVPMLIVLGLADGTRVDSGMLTRQVVGGLLVALAAGWLSSRSRRELPRWILSSSKEVRVFAGLVFCLGAAALTGWLGLSTALGAFVGGMALRRAEGQLDLRGHLWPVQVLFMAAFFLSVGLLFDVRYLVEHLWGVLSLSLLVFVVNSILTAVVLLALGMPLAESLATGCLLAQVGEFSFLLAATALNRGIIDSGAYRMATSVIVLTLLFTPVWLALARRLMRAGLGTSATGSFQAVVDPVHSGLFTPVPGRTEAQAAISRDRGKR